jgi:RHS repeat-associated protein
VSFGRRYTFLTFLVASVLVVGVTGPAYASPGTQPAASVKTSAPVAVPGITAHAVSQPKSSEPAGDFTDYTPTLPVPKVVTKPAPKFDSGSASVTSRSEYSNTSTDANGIRQTVVSDAPVNVKVGSSWVPSQTGLSSATGGKFEDATHPLHPQFGAAADSGSILHVARDGATLDFKLQGAASVAAQHPVVPILNTGADKISYPNALPNTDIHYQVQTGAVDESIVLTAAPKKAPTFTWLVSETGDVSPIIDKLGNLDFMKDDSTVVFSVPAPDMWDSSKAGGEAGGEIEAVAWNVQMEDASDWQITLSPSFSWLSDKARVYPVTIDPSVNPSADSPIHSYKSDGNYNNGSALLGFNAQSGSCCDWRAIVHYNYEQDFGQQLTGAALRMAYHSGQVNGEGDCFNMTISWASAFAYNGQGPTMGTMPYCYSIATTQSGDIGAYFNQWINTGSSGNYMFLVGDETQWSYRAMYTSLVLNTVAEPTISSVTGPVNGARSAVQTILQANSPLDPTGQGLSYDYQFSTTSNFAAIAYDSGIVGTGPYQAPVGALLPATTYYYRAYVRDMTPYGWGIAQLSATNSADYFKTNTPAPSPTQGSVYPADQSVVSTLAPLFTTPTVADVDGDNVQYQFRVATGADGNSGAVTTSGWLPQGTTTWTPPAGTLQDGVAYSMQVLTYDGYDTTTSPWVSHFTENLRIGDSGPSPTDTQGPVTVNLANGNASLSFTSPTVSTVGGPIGLSFQYNSLSTATKYQGLLGSYYNALTPGQTSTSTFAYPPAPILTRVDPTINFVSGTTAPGPSVPSTYFLAKWTGFVRVPSTGGPYMFGTNTDDGSKLSINGTQLVNQWVTTAGQQWASTATAASGPVPIEFDYYQGAGSWAAQLMVKDGSGNTYPVPSSWLTTSYQSLPAAWSASAPLTGDASGYTAATITTSSISLTDSTGTAHVYTKASTGGYTPPAGETGVVALDGSGNVVFTDSDGTIYNFNQAGKIAAVTSPDDLIKKAAPTAIYDPTTGRTTSLADPLAGTVAARQVAYVYQGDTVSPTNSLTSADSDSSGTNACPIPTGAAFTTFVAPPAGTLCRIVYPGHVPGSADTTQLFYNSQATVCPTLQANMYDSTCLQLAAILNPGGALSTFTYDGNGRLSAVRNPLENDWLGAVAGRTASTSNEINITYDSAGRATKVALPTADGTTGTLAPTKTYGYAMYNDASGGTTSPVPIGAATGTTDVDVTGAAVPAPVHTEIVTFNSSLQETSSTTPSGLLTQESWNNHDDLLATLSPLGLQSSTVYDSQDRTVASYGPAPASCFGGTSTTIGTTAPGTGACAALNTPVQQSTTTYDGGLKGLDVQWYPNATLVGPPTAETLGTGTSDGTVNSAWTTTAVPAPGINSAGTGVYSARLTGTVTFPTAGSYVLSSTLAGTAQLYLNDVQIINAATGTTAALTAFTATAGQVARIRVDYSNPGGAGALQLLWAIGGAAAVTVPGAQLSPNYSLATNTTSSDAAPSNVTGVSSSQVPSTNTTTVYGSTTAGANPWLGQVASTTIDPNASGYAGLNLTNSATYEGAGSGLYGRQLTSTKPAGATTTNTYYQVADTVGSIWGTSAALCGVAAGANQYGLLEKTVSPANSSGVSIETDYVYDPYGRMVGTRRTGETTFSCTTYDSRGRASQVVYSATNAGVGTPAGSPSRTVTSNFAVNGDPLITSVHDDAAISGLPAGSDTVTTVSDMDGNTVGYTDVYGTSTKSVYNQAGQLMSTTSAAPGAALPSTPTLAYTYDVDGDLKSEALDGQPIAALTYNTQDLLQSINYPAGAGNAGNGSAYSAGYDADDRQNSLGWSFTTGTAVTDTDVLSEAGRVLQDTMTGGASATSAAYTYDAAGRLTQAALATGGVTTHTLNYGFGTTTCGADTAAGQNGNRTSYSDQHTVTGTTTTSSVGYCYDNADRLTGTTYTGPTGVSPVLSDNLSITGTAPTLAYDAAGETTTLADETLTYDSTGRNTGITTSAGTGTTVSWVRDVTDRIVAETTNGVTVRYGFTSGGDSPDYTYTGTTGGTIAEHTLALSGGVTVSIHGSDSGSVEIWSFPDLHGDDIATSTQTGARNSQLECYDPFGDPIDSATGNIGTIAADQAVPGNTTAPGTSYGWEGSHQKLDETTSDIATIEMGARQYLALLGRFLSTDPIAGGNSNDYNYPNDPVNGNDLTGEYSKHYPATYPSGNPYSAFLSHSRYEHSIRGAHGSQLRRLYNWQHTQQKLTTKDAVLDYLITATLQTRPYETRGAGDDTNYSYKSRLSLWVSNGFGIRETRCYVNFRVGVYEKSGNISSAYITSFQGVNGGKCAGI